MFIDQPGIRLDTRSCSSEWITGQRVLAYGGATLVLSAVLVVLWAWVTHGFTANTTARPGVDFIVFWAASHAVLHGALASVYDYPAFSHIEAALFGSYLNGGTLPYVYPPTMLLATAPLALLPYVPSYVMFMAAGMALYARSILAVSGVATQLPQPRLTSIAVLAFPGVLVTVLVGQNSLLTAAIAAFAISRVERNPLAAGALIGLLAIKPQFGLLFPLVLIGIGAWRAIAGAAATTLTFFALAVFVCGAKSIHAFLDGTSLVRELVVEHFQPYWYASPSPFAAVRLAGYSLPTAYAIQAGVVAIAAAAAIYVWRATHDLRMRAAVFSVSSLLCMPYLWHYELAWLGIAIFCVAACGIERGWLPGEQPVLVIGWCLPAVEYFNRVMHLPQLGGIVLLAFLLVIVRRVRVTKRGAL